MNLIDLADIHAEALGIHLDFPGALLLGETPPPLVRTQKTIKRTYTPPQSTVLTDKQKITLAYIVEVIAMQGYPPSVRDIANAHGITVTAAKMRLDAVARKGYIERDLGRGRAIRVAKQPEQAKAS